jgi:hypothetical protein
LWYKDIEAVSIDGVLFLSFVFLKKDCTKTFKAGSSSR